MPSDLSTAFCLPLRLQQGSDKGVVTCIETGGQFQATLRSWLTGGVGKLWELFMGFEKFIFLENL